MKNVIGFFAVFALLFVILWMACPTDHECLEQTAPALEQIGAARYTYQVHNYYVAKVVVNNFTGHTASVAFFTKVTVLEK